ncbi:MAG: GNAT family N-acetyltransferase [Blastocatellia bacterium]
MEIIKLAPDNEKTIRQCAELLHEAFSEHWPGAWPTVADALEEVAECLAPDRILRVALNQAGDALGWIGGIPQYEDHVWELHPLAVAAHARGLGLGRRLVADLEQQARARGGQTLWLGTDDENQMTSLGGVDLYPNPLDHLRDIRNLRGHPYEFYQKLGFVITGVMPDANGPGKPDIYMAKRIP